MEYNESKTFDVSEDIKGGGSSIWGKSDDVYHITKIELERREPLKNYAEYGNYGIVEVYGDNTDWVQYTDREIEKQVETLVKSLDDTVESVNWSEQGMQPEKGWNFDVGYKSKTKNRKGK